MGISGRRPIPIEAQIAAGDPRKKGMNKLREIEALQPQAPGELPSAPEHLDGLALIAWETWSADLAKMGISKRPDAIMLEGACVAYQVAVKAGEQLKAEGLIVGEITAPKANPLYGIANKAWSQVRSFCTEFGLSPSSRTRLALEAAKDSGPSLADILNDEEAIQ